MMSFSATVHSGVFDWHTQTLRTPQSQGYLKKEGLVTSEEVFMKRFDKGNGEKLTQRPSFEEAHSSPR